MRKRNPVDFKRFHGKDAFLDEPKFAKFDRYGKTLYSLDDVKRLEKSWKDKFRGENFTNDIIKSIGRDPAYDEFCKEIDDFITNNERK